MAPPLAPDLPAEALARFIEHTLLRPDARVAQIEAACDEALAHGFFAVCVNGTHAARVARRLSGSHVATCVVVGFPLGAGTSAAKAAEAAEAVAAGAGDIDMVLDIGALKDGDDAAVARDIAAVRRACGRAALKVILETCLLTDDEKRRACASAQHAGADFVKTSTGFGPSGATVADVALLRRAVGPAMGVKASGGIRTLADARAMIGAGATRLGVSAGVAIVAEARRGASELKPVAPDPGGDAAY